MRTDHAWIREAYLQVDGRARLLLEIDGRERPLTIWAPLGEYISLPAEERPIDLDEGGEDGRARFIMHGIVGAAVRSVRAGDVPADVTELPGFTDEMTIIVCGAMAPFRRA